MVVSGRAAQTVTNEAGAMQKCHRPRDFFAGSHAGGRSHPLEGVPCSGT